MGKTHGDSAGLHQRAPDPAERRAATPVDTGQVPGARPSEALIALCAMAVVALICRWVFSPTHTPRRPQQQQGDPDYGLLVPVTTAPTADDAAMLRELLVAEGVRASVSAGHDVLVFRQDLERARALVSSR